MASRWNRNASFIRYTLHNVSSVWIVQSWFSFYADRLNENSCSCLSLLLRGITSVFNNTTGNTVCQSLCFLYRGRITQIQSLFYAFRGIEAHENQGFSATVGGQAGQIIQSPPEQASKCVENNPWESAGRGGLLALRPAFSHRLSFRMARISLFCKRCFMYSSTRTWGVPSRS